MGVPPIETLSAQPTQVAPVRRRSWAQISTTREIQSARDAARQAQDHKTRERERGQDKK